MNLLYCALEDPLESSIEGQSKDSYIKKESNVSENKSKLCSLDMNNISCIKPNN